MSHRVRSSSSHLHAHLPCSMEDPAMTLVVLRPDVASQWKDSSLLSTQLKRTSCPERHRFKKSPRGSSAVTEGAAWTGLHCAIL